MLKAEGFTISFSEDAVKEIARIAFEVRPNYTIM